MTTGRNFSGWNFADLYDAYCELHGERTAIVQGDRQLNWTEFGHGADAIAAALLDAGLSQQSKVGTYLYNCPEFAASLYGCFKAGLVPFNVNYRYTSPEIHYLIANADAEAVIFHASFAATLEGIRRDLPLVKRWIAVAESGFDIPAWAEDFFAIVAGYRGTQPVRAPWGRSGRDILIMYTGGTTGKPKGVMWPQEDIFKVWGAGAQPLHSLPPFRDLQDAMQRATDSDAPRPITLAVPPMMHGAGTGCVLNTLMVAGTVVQLPSRRFDALEAWTQAARHRATRVAIVGIAFARPLLEALDAYPGRWDLSAMKTITSTGSMWSRELKHGLLAHLPQLTLVDNLSASETPFMGTSVTTAGAEIATARFGVGPDCMVITEDDRRVTPGSGETGLLAVAGLLPMGYYGDPEKTAMTFRVIEGRRWSVPGDWARVHADGTIELLGRGSQCINTGGEKVFAEEVEEVLKRHPAVRDALVVGVPDSRFGECICAVVEPADARAAPSLPELAAHVKTELAHYKAPRELLVVKDLGRGPNGKADYSAARALALASRVAAIARSG